MRILTLITDAFGGHGGIALYNRDMLTALCGYASCEEVVAIPRMMPFTHEPFPDRLTYVTDGVGGKTRYISSVFQTIRKGPSFDLIICGHINLLPIAYCLKLWLRVPLVLEIYGIDVWAPTKNLLTNFLAKKIDSFISISELTQNKFLKWTGLTSERGHILPNAIHLDQYGVREKKGQLIKRYDLEGKTVLMTLGRLSAAERYKGFDEVIELLPEIVKEKPDIVYLIVGDGNDRLRLEEKVRGLCLEERVVFAGYIPEEEKADYYRLADAFIMPGRGEGFGFVFLEAMACGVPVVASKLDGSREAVLDGKLGIIVDPDNREEVRAGIVNALDWPKGVPEGLEYFSFENFRSRLHSIIDRMKGLKKGVAS